MDKLHLIIISSILLYVGFKLGTKYIIKVAARISDKNKKSQTLVKSVNSKILNSTPSYYGYCTAIWSFFPALVLVATLYLLDLDIPALRQENTAYYLGYLVVLFSLFLILSINFIEPKFKAREHFERNVRWIFLFCAFVSISITIIIFFSVLSESLHFFEKVNVFDFLFGLEWSPQTALRSDQAGSSGKFGMIPVFIGTLLITIIAMTVAIPLGLLSAIYLSEYAKPKFRKIIKPILEVLAGIPTVVYGYFAAITMGPLIREILAYFNIEIASESALAAGLVMGVMIIPFVLSLSDDVMNAVPRSLKDASLGLGATKSETVKKVIFPAALPGIMGACLLAVSRAIGETMIVVMAAGLIATLTINPLDSVTTVTAQIVKLLVGDQEFDSAKTLAAFALSLTLFIITLMLNFAALMTVKKYREKYE